MCLPLIFLKGKSPLRIGIDARFALGNRRGIGVYSLNLINSLVNLDCDHEFVLFTSQRDEKGELPADPRFKIRVIKPSFYPIWEQVLLPAVCTVERIDLLHCLANTAPLFLSKHIRLVVTIHDVSYLKSTSIIPKPSILYQRLGRIYRRALVPPAAAKATHVISVSKFALQDIVDHIPALAVTPKSATYLAPDPIFQESSTGSHKDVLKAKFKIDYPYILSVSGRGPQKNLIFSAKAFLNLKSEHKLLHKLVLVGVPRDEVDPYLSPDERVLSTDHILFIEWSDRADLLSLYGGAHLFLFGSLYESFGLPCLEALACGTPTLLANTGALPEISGPAACYFDPRDSQDLKDKLLQMATDPDLRTKMNLTCHQRAGQFSWSSMAAETLAVYNSLRPMKSTQYTRQDTGCDGKVQI